MTDPTLRSLSVWASHTDLGSMCEDTELPGGDGLVYPEGSRKGQAGWDVAVSFGSLAELAKKLAAGVPVLVPGKFFGKNEGASIGRGEIVRLGILAHGDQGGQVAINGKANLSVLSPATVAAFHDDLHAIGLYTRESGATIIFFGCLAGQSTAGTKLLVELSRVWPGRSVVGFSTTGYRHPGEMKRAGQPCELPGMRDTRARDYIEAHNMSGPDTGAFNLEWTDLKKMPWASESSPHAKVVKDGSVAKLPEGEIREIAPSKAPSGPPPREGKRKGGRLGY